MNYHSGQAGLCAAGDRLREGQDCPLAVPGTWAFCYPLSLFVGLGACSRVTNTQALPACPPPPAKVRPEPLDLAGGRLSSGGETGAPPAACGV